MINALKNIPFFFDSFTGVLNKNKQKEFFLPNKSLANHLRLSKMFVCFAKIVFDAFVNEDL